MCIHPHQGPGLKPLEGNGKCFHKLLWAASVGSESGSGQNKITCKGEKWKGKRIEVAHPSLFLSWLLTGSVESL